MKKIPVILLGLAVAVATTSAQSQSLKGTLIDNACFTPKMSRAELAAHSHDCALMADCVKSGYLLVTDDGHAFKLDAKGNNDVVSALKASSKTSELKVAVTGAVKGDSIVVASIVLDK